MRLLADDSKERHPKALGKIVPLHVGHLAVINEIALQQHVSEPQSTHACFAHAWGGEALRISRQLGAQRKSKQATAGGACLVPNNHNGHIISILHAQNLVSELRHLMKRGRTCDRVHNQEALPGAHVLVAHGAVFLLQETQEEKSESAQLAARLNRGGRKRAYLSRSV